MASGLRDRDTTSGIQVVGLKELQAELKRANPEFAKRLQVVNKTLVTNVANKAKAAMYTRVPGSTNTRHRRSTAGITTTRNSIRGTASGREAKVVAGGPKAPGFYGFEFGGSRGLRTADPSRGATSELGRGAAAGGRNRRRLVRIRTAQFPVHLGREGYFLYPTIRRELKTAYEDWNNLFDDVMGTTEA